MRNGHLLIARLKVHEQKGNYSQDKFYRPIRLQDYV